MIFFYIKNSATKRTTASTIPIPVLDNPAAETSVTRLDPANVKIVSWNEISCQIGSTTYVVTGLEDLKALVIRVAKLDEVCKKMNEVSFNTYGVCAFAPDGVTLTAANSVDANALIDRIFLEWAHPMIGNICLSPCVRPQTKSGQYVENWSCFPHIDTFSMAKICALLGIDMTGAPITPAPPEKLTDLSRSSHDQVRICPDLTTLARAIMGEITTIATRRLEKIFALELCRSAGLYSAQKVLIKGLLNAFAQKQGPQNILKASFETTNKCLAITEYVKFFFSGCTTQPVDVQWSFYVALIESAVDETGIPGLSRNTTHDTDIAIAHVADWLRQWAKIPPVVRCAVVLNTFRRFLLSETSNMMRISIAANRRSTHKIDEAYAYTSAADNSFLPTFSDIKLRYVWSWNRDEKHSTTITSRQHLLPLWGGPSGHSHGHVHFAVEWLKALKITVTDQMHITAVSLSSLFPFWRLYYDKRISAIHTIAETYEASIFPAMFSAYNTKKTAAPTPPTSLSALTIIPDYSTDVFSLVLACQTADNDVINPIRLMNSLNALYYEPLTGTKQQKFDALRTKLNNLRDTMGASFTIPLWSKPIIPDLTEPAKLKTEISASAAFKAIRIITAINVRIYIPVQPVPIPVPVPPPEPEAPHEDDKAVHVFAAVPGKDVPLWNASEKPYVLSEIYENIPKTISGNEALSLIAIENVHAKQTVESGLYFSGDVSTSAPFWQTARLFINTEESLAVKCHISNTGVFTMRADIGASFKLSSSLSVTLNSLTLSGGLGTDDLSPPYFAFGCTIGELKADIVTLVDSRVAEIRGHFGGDIFTLHDMAVIFGLGDLSFLPKDLSEKIFGGLGLSEINIALNTDPIYVKRIDFTLGAQNAWKLLGDKITFKPYLTVTIDNPFNAGLRYVDVNLSGIWLLGTTEFYTAISPVSGEITANSNNKLDITTAIKTFAPDVTMPQISIDNMKLHANYKSGRYELCLEASQALTFSLCGINAGITDTVLYLLYESGKLETFEIAGTFSFGGLPLTVSGNYHGADDWEFSASATAEFSLGKLLSNAAANYPSLETVSKNIPQSFLSFTIGSVFVSYASATKETVFLLVLGQIEISEGFTIDSAIVELVLGAGVIGTAHNFSFKLSGVMAFGGQLFSCEYNYSKGSAAANVITLKYCAKTEHDVVKLSDILEKLGFDIISGWSFITSSGISEAALSYDLSLKQLVGELKLSGGGAIKIALSLIRPLSYDITLSSGIVLSLADVPLVGGLTQKLLPSKDSFNVKDLTFRALSEPKQSLPAGLALDLTVLGEHRHWQIYESGTQNNTINPPVSSTGLTSTAGLGDTAGLSNAAAPAEAEKTAPKIFWIKLEKTLAIFTLHRLGLGLDGSYLMAVLDGSLSVPPFKFTLFGAGMGVDITTLAMRFYISGFGVEFSNETLSISGEFRKEDNNYSGFLLVKVRQISLFALAQYSEDGSLSAYGVLAVSLGGPPAFFVTGIALGFGYHKRLRVPDIDNVVNYPLVCGATGRLAHESMIGELANYITDAKGENFLAFGVKFTSFGIAESFALLTVSFGTNFEINLLGMSEITMPPESSAPIAKAQLALKASFRPSEGFFGIEARLTSESYILSKNCRLTGGFAFFMWFSGEHSGDFVITLGGYHPRYLIRKPAHYPDAPRIGFNWNIDSHTNVCGEMYFAVTPSVMMAGGRLSATYTAGNLKAYFIAKADFLISWKPFHYDIEIGIILGGSYYLDAWLFSTTIKLELGVNLHIWGPEFSGEATVDLYIASFTVRFGANAPIDAPVLSWGEFRNSFLPKENTGKSGKASSNSKTVPIKISFGSGLTGKLTISGKEYNCVSPNGVEIFLDSVMPITSASLNNSAVTFKPVNVVVRPADSADFYANLMVSIASANNTADRFTTAVSTKNLPTALWGGTGETLNNVPCGLHLTSEQLGYTLFPQNQSISLDDLYQRGATIIKNAFIYLQPGKLPEYTEKDTISVLQKTVNATDVSKRRAALFKSYGITESVTLTKIAADADRYFDEEVLIPL